MQNEELKPCPHCGGEARFRTHHFFETLVYVQCIKCRCCSAIQSKESEAAESWNNRNAVHGKWITGYCEKDQMNCTFCSVCGESAYWDTDYGQQLFDYCPYCGAKMTGDENDETD